MKVLILGVTGMLGHYVKVEARARGFEVIGVAEENADYCIDLSDDLELARAIETVRPEIVLNCSGEIGLNLCEKRPEAAFLINAHSVSVIAAASRRIGAYLIHVSTDHYYSGDGDLAHDEESPVKLLNVYARTKLNGERYALEYDNSLVVRTNIVGLQGRKEQTFIEATLNNVQRKVPVLLFNDFYTSSIHSSQFASALWDLIAKHPRGIVNLASSEVVSRWIFMDKLAMKMKIPMQAQCGSVAQMSGVRCAESLGLDVQLAERILGYSLPNLDQVLNATVDEWHSIYG